MKQKILDLLNTLPEEEQNVLMEEIVRSLKQERLEKVFKLQKEVDRLNWLIKTLN
jgi:hypothetical protein